ncbi:MAG: YgfZ/GcvT domain-containing protein [Ardenticatenaceae bacterium]
MTLNLMTVEKGVSMREVAGHSVVGSYGNDEAARGAFEKGAALVNRSDLAGLIRLTGSTRQRFLHNQTTNDFNNLKAGEGIDAVFVTATARTIDLITALATEDAIWMITSPERHGVLLNWMPRFVFFLDDVQFIDESGHYAILSLVGPQSGALLSKVGAGEIVGKQMGQHMLVQVRGTSEGADKLIDGVRVAVGSGLVGEGYTLIVPADGAAAVWAALREAGAEAMGYDVWESLRIEQGRPAADKELTEEHNPLEAGLWDTVSFRKGCYIGQEIIARLDTYQKLKQQLWGLRLSAPVQPNTPLHVKQKQVGTVTSVTTTPTGAFALAYIRTKAGGEGLTVRAGDESAQVVDLPYIRRGRSDI